MRVLVACERSGRVRDALLARGLDAVSCDLEPTDSPGPHIVGRAEERLADGWDMLLAFPPCTFLSKVAVACLSGGCIHKTHHNDTYLRWRLGQVIDAALLFRTFLDAPIGKVAVENPAPHPKAAYLLGRHTAHCEPWWFGDAYTKHTRLWLRGLQPLYPTRPVHPTHVLTHAGGRKNPLKRPELDRECPREDRPRVRSLTPIGLAEAMAAQWGSPEPQTLL